MSKFRNIQHGYKKPGHFEIWILAIVSDFSVGAGFTPP